MNMTGQTFSPRIQPGWLVDANHVALHVRDVAEAVRFWSTIFGAGPSPRFSSKRAFHVEVAGLTLAFFAKPGLVAWNNEYPHVAFTVTSAGLRGTKSALDAVGVATHEPWTRNHVEALMYFRDPTGNLFELYCPQYDDIAGLAVGQGKGGDYRPPLDQLRYNWNG